MYETIKLNQLILNSNMNGGGGGGGGNSNINSLLHTKNNTATAAAAVLAASGLSVNNANASQAIIATALMQLQHQQQQQQQKMNNKVLNNNLILDFLAANLNSAQNLNTSLNSTSNSDSSKQINYSRYKTELCRQFSENGECKYGDKCQFAHGYNDLKDVNRHPKYKTDYCKTFHSKGFCPYGPRCHFIHEYYEKNEANELVKVTGLNNSSKFKQEKQIKSNQVHSSSKKPVLTNQQETTNGDYSHFEAQLTSSLFSTIGEENSAQASTTAAAT